MRYIKTLTITLVAIVILSSSCKQKESKNCRPPAYYSFSHADSSNVTYKGNETLRFLYRNGQHTDTIIFKPLSQKSDTAFIESHMVTDYCYQNIYGRHHQLVYYNTRQSDKRYNLTINYTANIGAQDFNAQYDSINVKSTFLIMGNPNLNNYHPIITFEGTTFYQASSVQSSSGSGFYTIYYTAHEGIIRMEYKSGASLTLLP